MDLAWWTPRDELSILYPAHSAPADLARGLQGSL